MQSPAGVREIFTKASRHHCAPAVVSADYRERATRNSPVGIRTTGVVARATRAPVLGLLAQSPNRGKLRCRHGELGLQRGDFRLVLRARARLLRALEGLAGFRLVKIG